jgi:hypothetical protein
MSGFRHSENRAELAVLVDFKLGTYIPPGVRPVPPTLKGTPLDVDAPEWDLVLRLAGRGSCHVPASVALCSAEKERGQPRALCVMDAGRITLPPLVICDFPAGGVDAASPHGYPGPVGMGSEDPASIEVSIVAGPNVLREADTVSVPVDERPIEEQRV